MATAIAEIITPMSRHVDAAVVGFSWWDGRALYAMTILLLGDEFQGSFLMLAKLDRSREFNLHLFRYGNVTFIPKCQMQYSLDMSSWHS